MRECGIQDQRCTHSIPRSPFDIPHLNRKHIRDPLGSQTIHLVTERTIQTSSAPLRRLTGVQIVGTGGYVPDKIVRNEDLAALGCDPEWIIQRTGIRERRHAPPDMATSDMAIFAAERAMKQAGVGASDIDLVVLATFTPDWPVPASATQVQTRLGINAPAMDIQAACAGFIYALITGMQFVATGCSRLALVIGSDTNSRVVDPDDKKIYPLFGDGAGAVLLAPGSPEQGMLAYTMGSEGSGADLLYTPMGGSRMRPCPSGYDAKQHYLKMDGRPVFKWAVRLISQTTREVLDAAKLSINDLSLVVLHQANVRIIDVAVDELKVPREKILMQIERYGNTSAGSIPLVLDEANRAGRLRRGDHLLISGFGAGLAWGTGVLRW
jgi:3-oxoacyl-[acyl-carrier-protein] synthase-3